VSGDYYDFFSLPGGMLGMLLADVSGKGMPAALVGAALHSAVRSNALAAGQRCGEVLARASALLFESTSAERYATVFYGVFDPGTRMLSYANAGHCPPMILRGESCLRLQSLTPPVGLLPMLPSWQETVQLVVGDCLLIFSDGLPEAANELGVDFGDDGIIAAGERLRKEPAQELCLGVVAEVREHLREMRQPDDITLIPGKLL
jgi:sigma-B regulation protein RsbU (phosphoserine phosphatase)